MSYYAAAGTVRTQRAIIQSRAAPVLPGEAQRGTEIAAEARRIAQRTCLDLCPQPGPQYGQRRDVGRLRHRKLDIGSDIRCDPVGQPGIAQVAHGMSRSEDLAGHCHRRHPHPERLAGRQAAGIGERVQHNVDIVVLSHERPVARPAAQLDPFRVDAMCGKGATHSFRRWFV